VLLVRCVRIPDAALVLGDVAEVVRAQTVLVDIPEGVGADDLLGLPLGLLLDGHEHPAREEIERVAHQTDLERVQDQLEILVLLILHADDLRHDPHPLTRLQGQCLVKLVVVGGEEGGGVLVSLEVVHDVDAAGAVTDLAETLGGVVLKDFLGLRPHFDLVEFDAVLGHQVGAFDSYILAEFADVCSELHLACLLLRLLGRGGGLKA